MHVYGEQASPSETQLPAPSQICAVVDPAVHDDVHLFVPVVSGPTGMGEQVPVPLRLHAEQAEHSATSQQTPSVQKPVRQSKVCEHVPPATCLAHTPDRQKYPLTQSESMPQVVRHVVLLLSHFRLLAQAVGAGGVGHAAPPPGQVVAAVSWLLPAGQASAEHTLPAGGTSQAPSPSHLPSFKQPPAAQPLFAGCPDRMGLHVPLA